MKTVLALAAASALSGCATYDMYRDTVRSKIAEGYDRLLRLADRIECEDVSVGAWRRKYGRSPELAASWRAKCDSAGEELPMTPLN